MLFSNKALRKISEADLRQARQRPQGILCVLPRPITQHGANLAGKILSGLLEKSMKSAPDTQADNKGNLKMNHEGNTHL